MQNCWEQQSSREHGHQVSPWQDAGVWPEVVWLDRGTEGQGVFQDVQQLGAMRAVLQCDK
ncbi:hypothetical protein U0070_023711 [Myodes glareolus]|uniref:MHC class I antigen n=1 Tax=Myodes glareolus TaxID=447135 RepID=A0AAW0H9H5_MYOGA